MQRRVAIFTPTNLYTPQRYRPAGFELFVKQRGQVEILRLNTLKELLQNQFKLVSTLAERMRGAEVTTQVFPAAFLLSSALRARGHKTFMAKNVTAKALRQLEHFGPELICLSTTFMDSPAELAHISGLLKEAAPRARQIAGGMMIYKHHRMARRAMAQPELAATIGPTLFDDRRYLRSTKVDAYALGATDYSQLFPYVEELGHRRPSFDSIPNLCLRHKRGQVLFTHRRPERYDQAMDVIDWSQLDALPPSIPLRTSVGCPHACLFCDYCTVMEGVRRKSRRTLTRELGQLRELGASPDRHSIYCVDDNTFYSAARLREVCQAFVDSGIEVPWYTMTELDKVSPSNIELIKQTNLIGASVGLESGDDAILAAMNKSLDKRKFKRGAQLFDRNQISVFMTLLAGFPGETLESIERTAAFVDSLGLDQACSAYQVYPLTVLPLAALNGAESRARFQLEGQLDSWRHSTASSRTVRELVPIYIRKIKSLHLYHADSPRLLERELPGRSRYALMLLRRRLAIQIMSDSSEAALAETVAEMLALLGLEARIPDRLRDLFVMPKVESGGRAMRRIE